MEWDSMGWNGMGLIGWNGIVWDGMGLMGWNGMGRVISMAVF